MRKTALTFCASLCLMFSAMAGSVAVSQWLPWSFLSQELRTIPLNVSAHEEEISLRVREFSPVARDVSFTLQGDAQNLVLDQHGARASSTNLRGTIHIGSLTINQVITRYYSGNRVNIHIAATCSPITISVGQFAASIAGDFVQDGPLWNLNLTELTLSFPNGQWDHTTVSCSGVGGLENDINSGLDKSLADPSFLQDYLRAYLAPVIAQAWATKWAALTETIHTQLQNIQIQPPSELGVQIVAELPLKAEDQIGLPAISERTLAQDTPQFLLSVKGFEALIQEKVRELTPKDYDLQKLQGFHDLMQNRLNQLFVWPDLMNFATDAVFNLHPLPQSISTQITSAGGNRYAGVIKALGQVQVDKDRGRVPYLDWNIALKTNLTVTVTAGQLSIQSSKPEATVQWSYNADYVRSYRPNPNVNRGLIDDYLKQAFPARTVALALPRLHLRGHDWTLESWEQNGELIRMNWVER